MHGNGRLDALLGPRLAQVGLSATSADANTGHGVRWVARVPVSVHTKLLTAFLIVTALFFAMGVVSLGLITGIARQTVQLDEAHRRVDSSRQIEHALAMQMNFSAMALLLRDETTIANVLRENNRFNSTLARSSRPRPKLLRRR